MSKGVLAPILLAAALGTGCAEIDHLQRNLSGLGDPCLRYDRVRVGPEVAARLVGEASIRKAFGRARNEQDPIIIPVKRSASIEKDETLMVFNNTFPYLGDNEMIMRQALKRATYCAIDPKQSELKGSSGVGPHPEHRAPTRR